MSRGMRWLLAVLILLGVFPGRPSLGGRSLRRAPMELPADPLFVDR